MILPDDLDEKAEIIVGETDTEDEEEENQMATTLPELRSWEKRPRQHMRGKRRGGGKRDDVEHVRHLGNGLQISFGRKGEDVFVLRQVASPGGSTSGRQRHDELDEKSSSLSRLAELITESTRPRENESRRWITRDAINPQGLGLNIWPNHSFFSRREHTPVARPTSHRDSPRNTRSEGESTISRTGSRRGHERHCTSGEESEDGGKAVSIDEQGPNDRTGFIETKRSFIGAAVDWIGSWRSARLRAEPPSHF